MINGTASNNPRSMTNHSRNATKNSTTTHIASLFIIEFVHFFYSSITINYTSFDLITIMDTTINTNAMEAAKSLIIDY